MRIKQILTRNRRDFTAIYVCEHCDAEVKNFGYDDDNFHAEVIPLMKCAQCDKVSPPDYEPLATKYPAYQQV